MVQYRRICIAVLLISLFSLTSGFPQSRTQRFEKAEILSAVASSEIKGREASLSIDGKAGTWWTPDGRFQGEWILVEFARAERISAVEIVSFPSSSGKSFAGLKKGEIELSTGLRVPFELSASSSPQRILIPETPARWVKIIVSSYRGAPGSELRIIEISVLKVVPIYQL